MKVCYTSRFLPNSHPRVATSSHSIKTRLSNFLVCGSQLFSTRSPQTWGVIIPHIWVDSFFHAVMAGHLCRSPVSPLQSLKIRCVWIHPRGRPGTDQATGDCSWRKQGMALVLPSPLPPYSSKLLPGLVCFLVLELQYLPPPCQAQLLPYICLSLLFSQPLLPIKLDIRHTHPSVLFRDRVCHFFAWMAECCGLDGPGFIYRLHASLVHSPVQVFRSCVTLPHKTLNSPGRSQQKNPMLLSLGIAIALFVLSSGGDVGSVCVCDHFVSFSSQDSVFIKNTNITRNILVGRLKGISGKTGRKDWMSIGLTCCLNEWLQYNHGLFSYR